MDLRLLAATLLLAAPATAFARPAYLAVVRQEGTTLVRVAGDAGARIPGSAGTWGRDARHVYSKQAAWNADGTLLLLQNRDGGTPERLLLDGRTYAPRGLTCGADVLWDYRWHPVKPTILVNVDKAGRELSWFDVASCRKVASWTLPVTVKGIGDGEGNVSNDGRFVALGNEETMFLVDMAAPSGRARTGPLVAIEPCAGCRVDNLSVSPSGRYVDVDFAGQEWDTKDLHRVYEVAAGTLDLAPHAMARASLRCGAYADRTDGWIFPLKHADMTLDPFDGDADVLVGGLSCEGSTLGHVVKVRLRDGKVSALTDPDREAAVSHVSTRNLARPGWAYVSYFTHPGHRDSDAIVAVKLDGSRTVEHYGRTRTRADGCYRCEAHPTPSPDGRRVVFASNWGRGPIADYVVQRTTTNLPARSPSAVRARKK